MIFAFISQDRVVEALTGLNPGKITGKQFWETLGWCWWEPLCQGFTVGSLQFFQNQRRCDNNYTKFLIPKTSKAQSEEKG